VSKTMISVAAAAVLAASLPAAFAQTMNTAAPATPTGVPQADHVMPGQLRLTDMSGAPVYDAQNKNVGDINNVVLDPEGRVAAVAIKTGAFIGIGGKTIAIKLSDLKVTTDANGKPRFTLDMTQDQLKSAQAYDLSPPPNTASGSSNAPGNANRQ
jgi:sporulation protein YlmC with PRC-barrel domain